jgi:23S rRNA (adenine2503-C2)-methyltransferase
MEETQKIQLKNYSFTQLQQLCRDLDEKRFRAVQLFKWMYQKRVARFGDMRNVARKAQQKFATHYCIDTLPVAHILRSAQGDAVKFAYALPDNAGYVESVLLYDRKRRSACISSQMGCAMGCTFCETARMGFVRNLTQAEILNQCIGINEYLARTQDKPITNIVFMGMGEALANMEAFMGALSVITDPNGFNLSARRITVSTAGLVPGIEELIRRKSRVNLAVSLNAPTNALRQRIMPITRRYPLEQVLDRACAYARASDTTLTCEYTVVDGFNNSDEDARVLAALLRGRNAKVNCIAMNPHTGGGLDAADDDTVGAFAQRLHEHGILVTVRKSRGRDIQGACGQLSGSLR